MKYCSFLILLIVGICHAQTVGAQEISITLDERYPSSPDGAGIDILVSTPPEEDLVFPKIDLENALYLKVFHSWDIDDDESATAIVLPKEDGQLFYIDLNNDEDLTNDGDPIYFPNSQNELTFYLSLADNPEAKAGRRMERIPAMALGDPEKEKFWTESEGRLPDGMVKMYQRNYPDFTGEAGTFYFSRYVDLMRAKIEIDGKEVLVALFDYDQNGIFNQIVDKERPFSVDRFLVDADGNGILDTSDDFEVNTLDDVVEIGDKRYVLRDVDRFGRGLTLVETKAEKTFGYANLFENQSFPDSGRDKKSLDASTWDLKFETIDGEFLDLGKMRGKNILLNYWGEWCAPCISEIPSIRKALDIWSDDFVVIGILKTDDLEAARTMMERKEVGWPQVMLTDDLKDRFEVRGYPSNILLLPNGEEYIFANQTNMAFFQRNIQE